jgi:NAD(P)H-dependent FMN reductase
MEAAVHVVGLGGSLRKGSTSLAALQITLEAAAKAGASTRLFSLRELDLPMYRPDLDAPPVVRALLEAIATAQGMVWSSPLYNGSVSGSFKNAIDWLHLLSDHDPPYLTDQVIGLVTTAGGTQGLAGHQHHGVHRPRAARVGGAAGVARWPGLAGVRRRRPGPRRHGWESARHLGRGGRARRPTDGRAGQVRLQRAVAVVRLPRSPPSLNQGTPSTHWCCTPRRGPVGLPSTAASTHWSPWSR